MDDNSYKRCTRCAGSKKYSSLGHVFKDCTECNATGYVKVQSLGSDEPTIDLQQIEEAKLAESKAERIAQLKERIAAKNSAKDNQLVGM